MRCRPYQTLFISSLLLVAGVALPAQAETSADRYGVSVAGGKGALGQLHDSWRIAAQKHWQRQWLATRLGHFTGYWDLGLTLWDASDLRGEATDQGAARLYALGFGPVLRWQFAAIGNTGIAPFAELGVGLSALSDRSLRSGKIRSLPLGSYWQFEDRAVVGLRLGAAGHYELAYQRMHHSNLNLASANNGVDSHLLMLSMRF